MQKIKSFCVDHNKLIPGVYVSRIDADVITYDLRVKKPNTGDVIDNTAMHTAEHMYATFLRNSPIKDSVVYFGPMGCQTGFYLLVRDTVSKEDVLTAVKEATQQLSCYEGEVFGASAVECGNYKTLELSAAKELAREYLHVLKCVTSILTYEDVNCL